MLEDEGRAEFRLAVVQDALNAWMLDPLQHTCFPLRCAGKAVAGLAVAARAYG